MTQNDLRLLITAGLNAGKSIGEINVAISGLEKRINKLKLKIEIPQNFGVQINSFIKATEKMKAISKEQSRAIKEEVTEIEELDGTVKKYVKTLHANGEVTEKTIERQNKRKKALQQEADATQDLQKSLEKLNKEKLDQIKIDQNANNKVTGTTVTSSDGTTTQTQRLNAHNEIVKTTTRLNLKEQRELEESQKRLISNLEKLGVVQNTNATKERINNATTIKELRQIENELKDRQALEQKLALYQRSAEIEAKNLVRRFDGAVDKGDLDDYLRNVRRLNLETPDLNNKMKNLSLTFKEIGANARVSGSHAMTLSEMLQTAAVKFPVNTLAGVKLP